MMADAAETPKKRYAILRVGKIRSMATLQHVDNHNNRKVISENLINDTPPRELLEDGSDDFVRSAPERMQELAIPRPSTRGKIIAVEVVMTASRGWFEAATDEQKQEWLDACVAWVQTKFGEGLLSVKLHLDEEVWHIHAVAIPAVLKRPKKRGRPHSNPEDRKTSEALWALKAPRWTLSYEDLLGGHRMNLS
jgi:Plasmid recombination enzyme